MLPGDDSVIFCYCHFKAYYRQITYLLELCAYSSANLDQVFYFILSEVVRANISSY